MLLRSHHCGVPAAMAMLKHRMTEVTEHGNMTEDDASDGLEDGTITNEAASDQDGAPDDDVEVLREGI